jgi:pSer/pThr/pTyr-binding forkhead associated (FHA) protein
MNTSSLTIHNDIATSLYLATPLKNVHQHISASHPHSQPHQPVHSLLPLPTLHVVIINSDTLKKNMTIVISPINGFQHSLRNVNDGVTYFGYQDEQEILSNTSANVDFLIKPKRSFINKEEMNKFNGRHFSIRFNHNDSRFYLIDLGNGFGTFYKLEQRTLLKDGYLINIGNSYIVSNITNGNGIVLVVYNEYTDKKRYVFTKDDGYICIGRDEEWNDVAIKDGLLSRVHCTVWWDEEVGKWMVSDGKVEERAGTVTTKGGVASTNGTWMYVIEEKEITEGMIFKSNHNLFECKYKFVI